MTIDAKRLLIAATILLAACATGVGQNDSSGHIYIFPEEKIVNLNDTFSLYVHVDTVRDLKSFLLDVEVDTTVIQLVSATRESFFSGPSGAFFFWKDTVQSFVPPDSVYVYELLASLFGPTANVDGPGNLVKMNFVARAHGISFVIYRRVQLLDVANAPIVAADSLNGMVIVCPTDYFFGDADFRGIVNISDCVYLITYIFGGGPPPYPIKLIGDADCNDVISISDVVYIISYIFGGGPPPCNPCD